MSDDLITRIEQRLSDLGISANAASEKAGLNREFIREMKRPKKYKSGPSTSNLVKLARALDVSPSWLLTGMDDSGFVSHDEIHATDDNEEPKSAGSQTGRRGIPADTIPQLDVVAGLGGGGMLAVHDGIADGNGFTFAAESISDYWRLPAQTMHRIGRKAGNIAALVSKGDSMSPTIHDGDVVFVDTSHRVPSPPGIFALADEFGGIVIKRLEVISMRSDEIVMVRIGSDNKMHMTRDLPLSEIYIVGSYVGKFTTIL